MLCRKLKQIRLPAGVGEISAFAFRDTGLKKVFFSGQHPQAISDENAFDACVKHVLIIEPPACAAPIRRRRDRVDLASTLGYRKSRVEGLSQSLRALAGAPVVSPDCPVPGSDPGQCHEVPAQSRPATDEDAKNERDTKHSRCPIWGRRAPAGSRIGSAVLSLVRMIAKNVFGWCTVLGLCGGPEKGELITSRFRFDHAIDYKSSLTAVELAARVKACAPGGIDRYFDNVGDIHFEAAMETL